MFFNPLESRFSTQLGYTSAEVSQHLEFAWGGGAGKDRVFLFRKHGNVVTEDAEIYEDQPRPLA